MFVKKKMAQTNCNTSNHNYINCNCFSKENEIHEDDNIGIGIFTNLYLFKSTQ